MVVLFKVHEGYPLDDWQSGKAIACYVFDRNTRWWKHGSLDMYSVGVTSLPAPGSYRLHYDHDVGPTQQPIVVGDLLGCRQAEGAFTVETIDCADMLWSDITLYGGPGFGYFEGGLAEGRGALINVLSSWT